MHLPAAMSVLCLALFLTGSAAADPGHLTEIPERAVDAAEQAWNDPDAAAQDPVGAVAPIVERPKEGGDKTPPPQDDPPAFADRVRDALHQPAMATGLAGVAAALLGLAGFALVTRHISPKEALKNPQRAMLYGFVRGHPGVHLKRLSEEFGLKTSSILWHVRKLESAELVRSERANGFRVFYPVEGGIEIKRVSRAITALHNRNAHRILQVVLAGPGRTVRETGERLRLHAGTARWHLRKLREFGLVEELVGDEGSRFYGTRLGRQALETLEGVPAAPPRAVRDGAPIPVPE